MTAELYPDDHLGSLADKLSDPSNEKKWLINEIVKPQLPTIIDNIEKCHELLLSDVVFKMPMSNGVSKNQTAILRGILCRQRGNIVDFQAFVKFRQFHKGKAIELKMKTDAGKFKLLQIETICDCLTEMTDLLNELQGLDDAEAFTDMFGILLSKLSKAISSLENPPRRLLFPEDDNEAMKTMIENYKTICETTHHILSIELVLIRNEIMIEFRNLEKVTKKPWSKIDKATGQSFVDQIRHQLKSQRTVPIKSVMERAGVQIEEQSLLNSLISKLNTNDERVTIKEAQEFLNRCITFDGQVVMECERVSIRTSDPSLISVSSKLNSLANRLSTYYTNLKIV
ncbi:HEL174Wp [Eremothecium sinecaudum]|uniref:HEL174Wp n=1 Tax=Eremothecium sinecaudum TaxID=45286 RepID=A0A109UXB9_9SACH|nr:HEL174Wp [Eremothecium sinecaudum]AMD21107.1 HEL174Wp [Eremothecium sinecaudum]